MDSHNQVSLSSLQWVASVIVRIFVVLAFVSLPGCSDSGVSGATIDLNTSGLLLLGAILIALLIFWYRKNLLSSEDSGVISAKPEGGKGITMVRFLQPRNPVKKADPGGSDGDPKSSPTGHTPPAELKREVAGRQFLAVKSMRASTAMSDSSSFSIPNCFDRDEILLVVSNLLTIDRSPAEYEMGEIAHIENVMATEKRERQHTDISRSEVRDLEEVEKARERTRELETTERFELEKETQSSMSQSLSLQVGASVDASYMGINVNASVDFGVSQDSQTSRSEGQKFAREMTERAVENIIERVRTQRETTLYHEIIVANTHAFDNSEGAAHRSGIYRWVEKTHKLQIMDHGIRLLADVMIPDPAALYRYAVDPDTSDKDNNTDLAEPKKPSELELASDFDKLSANASKAITEYGADIDSPPGNVTVTTSTALSSNEKDGSVQGILTIPTGKRAVEVGLAMTVEVSVGISGDHWELFSVDVNFGGENHVFNKDNSAKNTGSLTNGTGSKDMKNLNLTGQVAIEVGGTLTLGFSVTAKAKCVPTDEEKELWTTDTWEKINQAYQKKLSEYQAAKAKSQDKSDDDAEMFGGNPGRNKQMMELELKRAFLYYLTKSGLDYSRSTENVQDVDKYPTFDRGKALTEGEFVRFLENAFDWASMTYLFYPYFWAERDEWLIRIRETHPDPIFEQFRRAGYARLVVPVREGFEDRVWNFVQTGCPNLTPEESNEYYMRIGDEIRALSGNSEDPTPYQEPWTVRLPTSLIKLQGSNELDQGN